MAEYLDPRQTVAHNLRALMAYAGEHGDELRATPPRVAELAEISTAAIYNFLGAKRAIDIVRLTKVAAVFGLAPRELLRPDLDPAMTPARKENNLRDALHAVQERIRGLLNPDQ